ncbi:MAG: hemerythrin domain-containing protein [Bacteroidales bacterium]|nr:hemerythrin domain-containing protein [Bacteroidales bacterium]
MKKPPFFTEKSKLYEMIAAQPQVLPLLSRFGIKPGFGDHSIGDVCLANGVDAKLFLLICNIYAHAETAVHPMDIDTINMDGLLPYLLASHRYYLDERFPHIEEHLQHIINAAGPKYGNMLSHFYNEYKQEVGRHFKYEEEEVFPYIEALRKGMAPTDFSIEQFRDNHSNIEDTLEDMMNILIKYLPSDILPKERIEISTDIIELSADLISHSLIEDHILIPYVETLENAKP